MKHNGVKCHIVGVTRDIDGAIDYVTVRHLEAATGTAIWSLAACDPSDLAVENGKPEVFDAIASVEGVTYWPTGVRLPKREPREVLHPLRQEGPGRAAAVRGQQSAAVNKKSPGAGTIPGGCAVPMEVSHTSQRHCQYGHRALHLSTRR